MTSHSSTTLSILLNGSVYEIPTNTSLEAALSIWGNTHHAFAIAINDTFIPRHAYANTLIQHNDHLEFLTPMQGG